MPCNGIFGTPFHLPRPPHPRSNSDSELQLLNATYCSRDIQRAIISNNRARVRFSTFLRHCIPTLAIILEKSDSGESTSDLSDITPPIRPSWDPQAREF